MKLSLTLFLLAICIYNFNFSHQHGIVCYVGYDLRRNPQIMQMEGCSVCRIVRRYRFSTAALLALETAVPGKPLDEVDKPTELTPVYTCFASTSSLSRCRDTCRIMRENDYSENEIIGECRCCSEDLCNSSPTVSTNTFLTTCLFFTLINNAIF